MKGCRQAALVSSGLSKSDVPSNESAEVNESCSFWSEVDLLGDMIRDSQAAEQVQQLG